MNWEVSVISSTTKADAKRCTVCFRDAWTFDETKCVFHTELGKRDEGDRTFYRHFREQVESRLDYSFRGYIFPKGFHFQLGDVNQPVDFTGSQFFGATQITSSRFKNKVVFDSIHIRGRLLFEDVTFEHSLEFSQLIFDLASRSKETILFRGIDFPPNTTFFRNIFCFSWESKDELDGKKTIDGHEVFVSEAPVFVFRQCCLKDVYFDNCDMGLFSFFKSSFFENAHIVACNWPDVTERLFKYFPLTAHTRKYIIPEEWLVRQLKSQRVSDERKKVLRERYDFFWGDLSYSDVGGIYRRIKTSLDSNKAYEEAAWLYFNEIEMRRVAWWEEVLSEGWRRSYRHIPAFLWGLIYDFYKICAGYGERPLNSAISFVLFLPLFASFHILAGLQVGETTINYDFSPISGWGTLLISQFWFDWLEGLKYALLRLVPLSYVPLKVGPTLAADAGLLDILLSLINTIILSLLLVFVGVGLKRHFRRF